MNMAVLLVVLVTVIGLSVRSGVYGRSWNMAESDTQDDSGFFDTCARSFVLVLLSLLGLLALGMTYGNVLGVNASP
ncbi:MAG: hypothetical protein ACREOM_12855 [Candidatus Dormibacteraceae bacterium]